MPTKITPNEQQLAETTSKIDAIVEKYQLSNDGLNDLDLGTIRDLLILLLEEKGYVSKVEK
jgi:hypothetical protein